MKAKTWAPAVLAVLLGGVAAKLVRDSMMKPHAPAAPHTMQVVVATENLMAGQDLKAEDLSTVTISAPEKPVDYCIKPAELVGRVLTSPIPKGEYILQSNLAGRGAAGGIITYIPAGMRAITINVDEGNTQAGMMLPGSRVDIVGTFVNGRKSVTRTLIKNVLVQAVGQRLTSAKPEDGKEPPPFHTVTLIVSPREAQMIDLTTTSGKMRLLLRGLTKTDNEQDPGNTVISDIQGVLENDSSTAAGNLGNPTTRASGQEASAAPSDKRVVEVIRGANTTRVEFDMSRVRPEADTSQELKPVIPGPDSDDE